MRRKRRKRRTKDREGEVEREEMQSDLGSFICSFHSLHSNRPFVMSQRAATRLSGQTEVIPPAKQPSIPTASGLT